MHFRMIEAYRVPHPRSGWFGDHGNGCFLIPRTIAPRRTPLKIIASDGGGWEHVSVSCPNRTPTWEEMEWVKKRTLGDVVAYQLHLPKADHINCHPHCLHIWRPLEMSIPVPPQCMVGPTPKGESK